MATCPNGQKAGSDLISLTFSVPAQAQPVEDPRWTQFTQQQDSLISNNVRAILTTEGALWFGTDAGISRYTGTWTSFPAAGPELGDVERRDGDVSNVMLGNRAPPGQTLALAADDAGRVWAGTDQGAVAVWEEGTWRVVVSQGPPVQALHATGAGLWIGRADGLYLWAEGRLTFIEAVGRRAIHALAADGDILWVGAADGLWRKREARWSQIAGNERWLVEGVYALWVDAQRTLWVGATFGVAWRHHSSSRWQFIASQDESGFPAPVQSLVTDHTGALWAGTDGAGAFSFAESESGQPPQSYSYGVGRDTGLSSRFVRGVVIDEDGSVWLATPVGVFRFQAYMWHSRLAGTGQDEAVNFINDLLVDRQGRLWVATGGAGLRRIDGVEWGAETHFGPAEGVPGWVNSLAQDDAGGLWAGTDAGLVHHQQGRWTRPVPVADLPAAEVTALLYTRDTLWMGTAGGLSRYDLPTHELILVKELMGVAVDALAEDGAGSIWVGAEPGIHVLGRSGEYTLHAPDGSVRDANVHVLPGGPVTLNGLAADPHTRDGMWVNLRDVGLAYWDGARWRKDSMGEQAPGSLVWRVSSDGRHGSLWIGSESGLARFDGATWALLTPQDGLQTSSIHAITPSPHGGYWIGGRNGLTHFRPDHTAPWIRVSALGSVANGHASQLRVEAGEITYLNIAAGDLQTTEARMKNMFRLGMKQEDAIEWGAWESIGSGVASFPFSAPGHYRLEFVARDLSFNYSEPVGFDLDVVRPLVFVTLPGLGQISEGVFRALLVLGLMVVTGSTYISVELVRHRRRSLEALQRKFNPYISGEPVRRDDMFFGRRALLQRIVDTLHHNSIMIHGERRIGKTTLLYQLSAILRDVDDPDYWFVPVYIDLEGTEQHDFFHYLIEEISHAVEAYLEIDVAALAGVSCLSYRLLEHEAYTDREFNRDLRHVVQAMQIYGAAHEAGKQARLILLLDEMDVVSGFDQLVQQKLRRIFMREFAATVGAVVAGIRISKAWERVESPWFNLFNEIALEPFTREQGRELLVEPVKGYYRYRPEAIEFILDMADGRPFRIQQYGLESVNQMLLANRRTVFMDDAQRAHERLRAVEMAHGPAQSQARLWVDSGKELN